LFASLSTGCVANLTHLDLSRCVYSNKKLTRDVVVPMSWKDFFSRAVALQSVNFAGCRLPNEAVKYVTRLHIGVPDRGAGRAVAPLGFGKLVKFGQMGWEIRAFRGMNFSR